MRCEHAHDDGAYVLGALSPAERAAYERHLATCSSCREAVADIAVLPGLLGRLDPADFEKLLAPDCRRSGPGATSMPDLVMAAQRRRRRERQRVRWRVRGSALAAAVLAAGRRRRRGVLVGRGGPRTGRRPAPIVAMTPVAGAVPVHGRDQPDRRRRGHARSTMHLRLQPAGRGVGAVHVPAGGVRARTARPSSSAPGSPPPATSSACPASPTSPAARCRGWSWCATTARTLLAYDVPLTGLPSAPRQRGGRTAAGSAVAAAESAAVLPLRGPGAADAVHGEDDQRDPDQGEAGQPGRRHRLVEDQHAAGQLQDRRDVLQHAEADERHPVGRAGEEQQRDRRGRAGQHQQHGVPGRDVPELARRRPRSASRGTPARAAPAPPTRRTAPPPAAARAAS